MFLNGMVHVAHSQDGIWLGEAYVRYRITNSLTCRPFQGSQPHRYYSYQRYNGDYDQRIRGKIDKDKT